MDIDKKRYNEILGWIINIYPSFDEATKRDAEYYFPELKESEDEKIKRVIMNVITKVNYSELDGLIPDTIRIWLEKQSEQKPVDKVEPKFKVDDWIVENEPNNYARFIQILEVVNAYGKERYKISRDLHNDEDVVEYRFIENNYHSFTIQDARDGDVLAAHECLVLFKEIDGLNIRCYCTYHYLNHQAFYVDTLQNKTAFHPATKEQRNTLEKAMADAGYTFDFEKKELKKIEQPSVCGEKDEVVLDALIRRLEGEDVYVSPHLAAERLKSLKERYTWKPSDEQMEYLAKAITTLGNEGDNKTSAILYELWTDLKKLK